MFEAIIKDVSGVILAQFEPIGTTFDTTLHGVGNATFTVKKTIYDPITGQDILNPIMKPNIVRGWNRVDLYYIYEGVKYLVWEGWLVDTENRSNMEGLVLEFICVDFWGWINRKMLNDGRTYEDADVKDVLTEQWNRINSQQDTGFTIDCDILNNTSPKVSGDMTFRSLLYDAIEYGAKVRLENNVIIVKRIVGDYLTETIGKEIIFKFNDETGSTVSYPKNFGTRGGDKMNYIIAKGRDDENIIIDDHNEGEEILATVQIFEKYAGDDLQFLAEQYLAKVRNDKVVFDVTPRPGYLLPWQIKVGDTIFVNIEQGDEIFDVKGNFNVTKLSWNSDLVLDSITLSLDLPFEGAINNIVGRLKVLEQTAYPVS